MNRLLTPAIIMIFLLMNISGRAVSLEKRHQLELRLGIWNQVTDTRTEIGVGGVTTSVGSNGAVGGIGYGYWFDEDLAFTIKVGGMVPDMKTKIGLTSTATENASVGSLLFGLKKYFPHSSLDSPIRPFGGLQVGPFIGNQDKTVVDDEIAFESRTGVSLGGQVGLGVDFILGRKFLAGVLMGYNLMTDFNEPIGGSKNYSGPELTLGIGFLFGKGVR